MCDSEPMAITVRPVSEALFDDVETILFRRAAGPGRPLPVPAATGWAGARGTPRTSEGRRELLRATR